MSKTTKILLLILVIAAIGVGIYFIYNKYYEKPKSDETLLQNSQDEWAEYNKRVMETSYTGSVDSISSDKIVVDSIDGKKTYNITDATVYQKLGAADANGQQVFEEASASDFKNGDQVWVFFDQLSPDDASTIKLMNIDVNYVQE